MSFLADARKAKTPKAGSNLQPLKNNVDEPHRLARSWQSLVFVKTQRWFLQRKIKQAEKHGFVIG